MLPQLLAAAIGVWLMLAPLTLNLGSATSNLLWLLGPIATSIGLVAAHGVTRGIRRLNVIVGLALVVVPALRGADLWAAIVIGVSGLALIGLGLIGSKVDERFGGGWRSLF